MWYILFVEAIFIKSRGCFSNCTYEVIYMKKLEPHFKFYLLKNIQMILQQTKHVSCNTIYVWFGQTISIKSRRFFFIWSNYTTVILRSCFNLFVWDLWVDIIYLQWFSMVLVPYEDIHYLNNGHWYEILVYEIGFLLGMKLYI